MPSTVSVQTSPLPGVPESFTVASAYLTAKRVPLWLMASASAEATTSMFTGTLSEAPGSSPTVYWNSTPSSSTVHTAPTAVAAVSLPSGLC